jgi:hypothetical protein
VFNGQSLSGSPERRFLVWNIQTRFVMNAFGVHQLQNDKQHLERLFPTVKGCEFLATSAVAIIKISNVFSQ